MRPHVISVPYRYDEFNEGPGRGPDRLLELGLRDAAATVETARLADDDREDDRTAVNIGALGKSTAALVARARSNGEPVLVVAGDDTATVGVVAGLQEADGASAALGIVWMDAHGDFNTPDTSYSGILAGMPLAVIAGLAGPRWRDASGLSASVPGDRLLLLGVRDLDTDEEALLSANRVGMVTADDVRRGDALAEAVSSLAARCHLLFVNIDLDVLDPRLIPSSSTPSAGGLDLSQLEAALGTVLETGKVAAISVTSLNPVKGARGQTSAESAWSVIQQILTAWTAVPGPPASYND
jgi:arginase